MSYLVRELKPAFERFVEPLVNLLQKLGVTPNLITVAGLILTALGSLALYYGSNLFSFLLLLAGALSDAFDGSLARRLGKTSSFGALLDSLSDRISDAMPFIAIALSSQDRTLSLVALLALLFSYTVSYTKARAEGLGYEMKVGLFERPERWILLLVGIFFDMLFLVLTIIAFGSLLTTIQRVYVFKKLARR
ncbi:MAG: CDP-alcohol phosphatidyltransferase family protein [Aquificaceae bacterium]|nr:CDP-alcohol phosphatidyltransferase family protein [Aquificaceae bacterium]MCX8163930.1 CDP-alcohol phosphatidyltransferase family protein [Aquificaceae bacterium]